MDMYIRHNQESLDAIWDTFKYFQKNSGFKVSYGKTNVYHIGSLKGTDAKLYMQEKVS